jgi:hypothetical protein
MKTQAVTLGELRTEPKVYEMFTEVRRECAYLNSETQKHVPETPVLLTAANDFDRAFMCCQECGQALATHAKNTVGTWSWVTLEGVDH